MSVELSETREEMQDALSYVLSKKWIVIIITFVGLIIGAVVGLFIMPRVYEYKATSTVVGVKYMDEDSVDTIKSYDAAATITYSEIVVYYYDLVYSLNLATKTAEKLNDDNFSGSDIRRMVSSDINNSQIMVNINAEAESRETAIKVANAMAETYVEEMNLIIGEDGAKILDRAGEAACTYSWKKMAVVITFLTSFAMILITIAIIVFIYKRKCICNK